MSEWLTALFEQPAAPFDEATRQLQQPLCFVIDRVRQPEALAKLYRLAEPPAIGLLFHQTEFTSLLDHSPIWVATHAGSEAARLAAALCIERRSGIALSGADGEAALRHARHLLKALDTENGHSLVRYYDPAFWSAWALTWPVAALYGPWSRVYTPPACAERGDWRTWASPADEPAVAPSTPRVAQATLDAFTAIRWWYWLDSRPERPAMADTAMPVVIDNLQLLAESGIEEGRHLQRLLPRLGDAPWRGREDILALLRSDLPAYEKVKTLEV